MSKIECPICLTLLPPKDIDIHVNTCMDKASTVTKLNGYRYATQKNITAFFAPNPVQNTPCKRQLSPSNFKDDNKRQKSLLLSTLNNSIIEELEETENKTVNNIVDDLLVDQSSTIVQIRTLDYSKPGVGILSRGSMINYTKPIPDFKIIPNTNFSVDAFCYGVVPDITCYFLTHYHSDHYGGLTKKFKSGLIYCSPITANLIEHELKIDPDLVRRIDLNTPTRVENATVTFIEANHCPGAILIIFEIDPPPGESLKRLLHTGDFRYNPEIHLNLLSNINFSNIYLDTTYLKPEYHFPRQDAVLGVLGQYFNKISQGQLVTTIQNTSNSTSSTGILKRWLLNFGGNKSSGVNKNEKRTLVFVGSYTIGKEKVFLKIAKSLNSKIYASSKKQKTMKCLENEEIDRLFTTIKSEADVHVVSMMKLKKEDVASYLEDFPIDHKVHQIIVIRPTGWTFHQKKASTTTNNIVAAAEEVEYSIDSLRSKADSIKLHNRCVPFHSFGIPYSEHSSFDELKNFLCSFEVWPENITSTVSGSYELMDRCISAWKLNKKI